MDGWMEEWTDGRKDRPYFIGPFRPRTGVQKGFISIGDISTVIVVKW